MEAYIELKLEFSLSIYLFYYVIHPSVKSTPCKVDPSLTLHEKWSVNKEEVISA